MTRLGSNRFGKAEVRVVRVGRGLGPDGRDVVRDYNVSSSLSGDLAETHLTGDNAKVLATDTQKNTTYAFAKRLGPVEPEELALALSRHYVTTVPAIHRARVAVEEYAWAGIDSAEHSFLRSAQWVRTTVVIHDQAAGESVVSGVRDLTVLNTTNSEFSGFPRDEFTTLSDTKDRMLATQVCAAWRYRPNTADVDFGATFQTCVESLLSAFATTYSYSLQQSLYAIGEKLLDTAAALCEVRLTLPNKHHFLVDLAPFGLPNDNEVYYAADRPYGLIEGSVLADDAPPEGLAWT